MPLSAKGKKILASMKSSYGDKKGTSVFYASRNSGKISGVDPESSRHLKRKALHHLIRRKSE